MKKLITLFVTSIVLFSCSKKEEVYGGQGELIGLSHKSADSAGFTEDMEHSRLYGIEIEEDEKLCEATKDCTSVPIRCSGHCGSGVNIKFLNKYQEMVSEKCKTYNGPRIKVSCRDYQSICNSGVCEYSKSRRE